MKRFFTLLSAAALRPCLVAVSAAFTALLLVFFFVGFVAGGYPWSQARMTSDYEILRTTLDGMETKGAPESATAPIRSCVESLGNALSQETEQDYLKELGTYAAVFMETLGPLDVAQTANMTFLVELSKLDQPELYITTRDYPGSLAALCIMGNNLPCLLLFLFPLAASWATVSFFARDALLASAPVARWKTFLMATAASWVCALVALVVACLPVTAAATLINGWGDPSYPLVYVQSEGLVSTTSGELAATFLGIYALAAAFLCVVACALALATGSPLAGIAACAGLLVLPEFSFWTSTSEQSPLLMLPNTYFDVPSVAGRPQFGAGGDISAVQGAVPSLGAAVLAAWCAATLAVATLVFALMEHRRGAARDSAGKGTLSATGLCLSFGAKTVLEDADLHLATGTINGLVAPNGYGKTTLLKALAGEARCRVAGAAAVEGIACGPTAACHAAARYATGAGRGLVPHMSVRRQLQLVAVFWDSKRDPEEALRIFGADSFARTSTNRLSQGMAQIASLALAWETDCAWLLLDEPMNALDPTNIERVSNALRAEVQNGKGIVMSSHILSNVDELCGEMWLINNKKLERFEGGHTAELYRRTYGSPEPTQTAL